MTEIHPVKRRPKFRGILFVIIVSVAVGVFFMVKSCNSETSPIIGNILLEKGGKKFLYSGLSADAVKASIERGESPQIFNTLLVYQDGDEFFVAPSSVDKIAAIASGEYELHNLKEASVEGYVTVGKVENYSMGIKFKTAAKLGEQNMLNTVSLKNSRGSEMKIEWTYNSKDYSYSNLKNCEMRDFWTKTQHTPGETIYSSTEFLVVPLKTLAKFFKRKMSFDPETSLLIIQE